MVKHHAGYTTISDLGNTLEFCKLLRIKPMEKTPTVKAEKLRILEATDWLWC